MSQENAEIVRNGIAAWNRRDAELWLTYATPEIEWVPAGPAAVEQDIYKGYDEVARGLVTRVRGLRAGRLRQRARGRS